MPSNSRARPPEVQRPAPTGYVDTHCHLDDDAFQRDLHEVLQRASAVGVRRWINVGYAPERWASSFALVADHPGMSFMLGVHPGHADDWNEEVHAHLEQLVRDHAPVAIGEIGLDFYRGETNDAIQVAAFTAQLAIARNTGIPAVIHMRDAEDRVLEVLRAQPDLPPLLFHSYDGSQVLTDWVIATSAYVGVGGLVTRGKSRTLAQQVRRIPIQRIVLETDSPYLVPNGFKHRRNTPESIPCIAQFVSGLFDVDVSDVARETTRNAERLFPHLPTEVMTT